jgi:hypothetical protein
MVESFEVTKERNGEESKQMEAQCHVKDATPPLKAAITRLGNHTLKVDGELFRVQDQDSSRYEIYNFNSTELDVSVSAQLAVKLIESPVPPKYNQPK